MLNLGSIGAQLTKFAARTGLKVTHYRPEILIGVGVVGIFTGVVFACKATLKLEDVVDKSKEKIDEIKNTREQKPEAYSENDSKKDLAIVYGRAGWDIVKLYAPTFIVLTFSVGCIIGSNRILRRENTAIAAAYMGLSEAFKKYRQRVVNDVGRDKDREYQTGFMTKTVELTDDNGVRTTTEINVMDNVDMPSKYARYFDASNVHWQLDPTRSMMFLRSQQNYANDVLKVRGHIFLNEVYDMLGFPRSEEGQVVGWVKGYNDDFVDFGLYNTKVKGYADDHHCDTVAEERRDFVNGGVNEVLLDFNVDGPIWHIFNNMEFKRKMLDPKA